MTIKVVQMCPGLVTGPQSLTMATSLWSAKRLLPGSFRQVNLWCGKDEGNRTVLCVFLKLQPHCYTVLLKQLRRNWKNLLPLWKLRDKSDMAESVISKTLTKSIGVIIIIIIIQYFDHIPRSMLSENYLLGPVSARTPLPA